MTYAGLATTLAGLTVTGVQRSYTAPPAIDTSGNYPAMFPRLPTASGEAITLTSAAGLKTATAELIIVVEADALGTSVSKFDETIALIDALDTALATEAAANNQIDSWTITPEITDWGWALVATVEATE